MLCVVCLSARAGLDEKELICPQVLLSNCTSLEFEDTIPADVLVGTESCSCLGLGREGKGGGK